MSLLSRKPTATPRSEPTVTIRSETTDQKAYCNTTKCAYCVLSPLQHQTVKLLPTRSVFSFPVILRTVTTLLIRMNWATLCCGSAGSLVGTSSICKYQHWRFQALWACILVRKEDVYRADKLEPLTKYKIVFRWTLLPWRRRQQVPSNYVYIYMYIYIDTHTH